MIEKRKKVLVVDDSAFMRSAMKGMISTDPELEVIGTARDGEEAVEKAKKLKPDLITMDIEMPRMDGITAVRTIMKDNPIPILIVSSLAEEQAQVTFDAMDAGAVDFICKDLQSRSLNILNVENDLLKKIKSISSAPLPEISGVASDSNGLIEPRTPLVIKPSATSGNVLAIVIGVSTGGPKALKEVIPFLPKALTAPVVIVQHMPAFFTKSFAERLNAISELDIKEAEHGDLLKPGMAVVAKGGMHLRFQKRKLDVFVELSSHPKKSLYKPSVDEAMLSASRTFGGRVLGVVMTGMGNDGCVGIQAIKDKGGKSLVQDEATSIVYGMPKAVVDAGVADKVMPLGALAAEIVNMV